LDSAGRRVDEGRHNLLCVMKGRAVYWRSWGMGNGNGKGWSALPISVWGNVFFFSYYFSSSCLLYTIPSFMALRASNVYVKTPTLILSLITWASTHPSNSCHYHHPHHALLSFMKKTGLYNGGRGGRGEVLGHTWGTGERVPSVGLVMWVKRASTGANIHTEMSV